MARYFSSFFSLFLALFLLFLGPVPLLKASPSLEGLSRINGLKIRLVPGQPEPISGLGTKTIEVSQDGPDILVKWFSPARGQTINTPQAGSARQAGSAPWPEYLVNLHRGAVHTNGLNEATSLAHPHLWIEGVVQLDQNGLLWIPPKIVEEAGQKGVFSLEPGFLSLSFPLFKKGPPDLIEKIAEFRMAASNASDPGFKKFLDEFSAVRVTDVAGRQTLVVNGEKTEVPVMKVGNKYVEYTVLAIASNPLVLEVAFRPSVAPKSLRSYIDFFHQYLEYKITQVYTGN
ncbi:MAG: hypothetical protein HY541_00345 [Deltaproteobacteria bacterium]|nr:hypothetical protein [Deltaproteobacteria bacterium]